MNKPGRCIVLLYICIFIMQKSCTTFVMGVLLHILGIYSIGLLQTWLYYTHVSYISVLLFNLLANSNTVSAVDNQQARCTIVVVVY